ncbi:MAG: hypothetical protein RBT15_04560 [Gudongella sp.]|jgi:CRISPR/Cas system-associated protein Csx1|nr:hypothetical protein [Gudongella sp.]
MRQRSVITILVIIIVIITITALVFYTNNRESDVISSHYEVAMQARMISDFQNFGEELQLFNNKLLTVLEKDESFSYLSYQYFINDIVINNFFSSNFFSAVVLRTPAFYTYEEIYTNANKNITNMFTNSQSTTEGYEYLQALYNYNKLLLLEWENIMLDFFPDKQSRTSEEFDHARLEIISTYHQFSKKSEELLSAELLDLHGLLFEQLDGN